LAFVIIKLSRALYGHCKKLFLTVYVVYFVWTGHFTGKSYQHLHSVWVGISLNNSLEMPKPQFYSYLFLQSKEALS